MATNPVTESELEALLVGLFDNLAEAHPDDFPGEVAEVAELMVGVKTLASGGYLTRDKGVELTLADGSTFLLTVQEVRR